jgi:acid phosphatase type 7
MICYAIRFLFLFGIIASLASCQSDKHHEPVGKPPMIISPTETEADAGVFYCYVADYQNPDGSPAVAKYDSLPSWLAASADSVCGVPPIGAADTSFRLIVSAGRLADTQHVSVSLIRPILIYGDTRTNNDIHRQIAAKMLLQHPVVVFHTGDLISDGFNSSEWDTFNTITADLRATAEFFPALGNHENQSPLFFENFVLPGNEQWYSINRNKIHFVVLNSCVSTKAGTEQFSWLQSDLENIPDSIMFIVAVLHHPPYSTGPHAEDEMGLRQTIVPLFEQYGVDVVFTGHDHSYERSYCGGRYYIVTGGGGAPMYDQTRQHPCSQLFLKIHHYCRLSRFGDELRVRIYDGEQQVIDQFVVAKFKSQ